MVCADLTAIRPAPPVLLSPRRPRLIFLDGLRGFTALYVVLHHIHSELVQHGLTGTFEIATRFLQLGHYAVGVFIVISGFSLMLPVAMSSNLHIDGGLLRYLSRRARRDRKSVV